MAGFSAVDAAVEGLKLTRDKPGVVALWAVVYLAGFAALGVGAALVFGSAFLAGFTGRTLDPETLSRDVALLVPLLLLTVPLLLIVVTVLVCAMYRSVLQPERREFAYLRFGGDELRLILLSLLLGVVAVIGVGIVVGAVAAVAVATDDGFARFLIIFVSSLGGTVLAVWLGVRLSLAAPMTFAERRISIVAAWRLTQGRFWPLLGAYLLALVFALVASTVFGLASMMLLMLAGGGGLIAAGGTDTPNFAAAAPGLILGFILYMAVQIIGAMLQMVIQTVPAASAYRQLSHRTQADVFS